MRPKYWLAWVAILEVRSVWPMTVTPPQSTTSSATQASQLPPFAAARSTTTEPGLITSSISRVISTGARRPGMSAVVMTMSTSSHCCLNRAISAAM